MKGETVCAKFEGINLSRNGNGNPTFSNLELNVNGMYTDDYYRGSSSGSSGISESFVIGPYGAEATGAKGPIRH